MERDKVVVQNVFEVKGQGLVWTEYFPERITHCASADGVALRPNFLRG